MGPLDLAHRGRLAFLAGLSLAFGCATTRITASERDARVFVDGRLAGRGEAEVGRLGLPGSAEVVVKAPDGRLGRAQMKRHFRPGTLIGGFFTLGICWLACWAYPDTLHVPLDERRTESAWEPSASDPWLRPPPGWNAPPPAAPPPPLASPAAAPPATVPPAEPPGQAAAPPAAAAPPEPQAR